MVSNFNGDAMGDAMIAAFKPLAYSADEEMAKMKSAKAKLPCYCQAYAFPHRKGSGKCGVLNDGAPDSCSECPHGEKMRDPYATGDWSHTLIECNFNGICPWGLD